MVVSTVAILLNLFVPLLAVVVNWLVYVIANGGEIPGEGYRAFRDMRNWYGLFPVPLPWWFFAVLATPLLVVAILTRRPEWRWDPPNDMRAAQLQRTTPRFLVGACVTIALVNSIVVGWFDASLSLVSPYQLGTAIALAAAGIALVTAHRDSRLEGRTAQGSPLGRALGVLSAVVYGMFWIVGPLGLVAQQLWVTLTGAAPVDPSARSVYERWNGALPAPVPWEVFMGLGIAAVVIAAATGSPTRQYAPSTPLAFLARTTPGLLGTHAFVAGFLVFGIVRYDSDAVRSERDVPVMVVWLVAALVTYVLWRVGNTRAVRGIEATGRAPRTTRKNASV